MRALLCSYYSEAPVRDDKPQYLYDQAEGDLDAGKTKKLKVKIKDCFYWQVDAVVGAADCPSVTKYSDDWWAKWKLDLLEANSGRRDDDCDKGCVKPEAPKCPYGPPIYDPVTCTFTCPPCFPPPPPECRYGPPTLDDNCSWKCPPCTPIECEEGYTFDKELCDCICTLECPPNHHLHLEECKCVCDPIGQPECPEQVWNEVTCQWEGDCICTPEGKPDCPEQTWDEVLCEWVGCCPEGKPECAEQEWDFDECEWEGDCPNCEDDLEGIDEGCYSGNIDTEAHLFDYFGIEMDRIRHDDGMHFPCRMSLIDADLVVVKGGPGFNLYKDVKKWDLICTCKHKGGKPDISHISYFDCPR